MPFVPRDKKTGFVPRESEDFSARNLDAMGNAAISRAVDNAAGFPDAILEMVARGGPASAAADFAGNRILPGYESRRFDLPKISPILPSGENVVAGADSFLRNQSFDEALAENQAVAEQNPIADATGNLLGDAATLFAGRLPLKRGRTGGVLDEPIEKAMEGARNKLAQKATETGLRRQGIDILEDERFQLLARGTGRTFETGAEAAFLSMLQDGDPAETAGLAMAGQALSSGALTIGKGTVELPFHVLGSGKMSTFGKASVGLAISGALMTSLFQFFQQNPDQAAETAYDKLTAGALLALTLGLPGKRPKDDGLLKNFPAVADGFLTVPRTAMINAAQAMAEDPVVADVTQAVAENPEAFGRSRVQKFWKWMQDGTYAEKIRELYESDSKFSDLVNTPSTLRGVPVSKRRNRGPGFNR